MVNTLWVWLNSKMNQKVQGLHGFLRYMYNHQFIRYLFVGGTTFILDEGGLIALHGFLKLALPLALFTSYLVAFVYNFTLNRTWAFNAAEAKSLKHHIRPYTILFFFNLIFSIVFVSTASHFINYAIAKAISVAIQVTWTFFIYKKYIFVTMAA